MSEDETEIEFEGDLSREAIADHLETFADGLRGGDPIDLDLGEHTVSLDPPETLEFEVEIEDEPEDDGVERSVEFELEWMRQDHEDPLPEEELEE